MSQLICQRAFYDTREPRLGRFLYKAGKICVGGDAVFWADTFQWLSWHLPPRYSADSGMSHDYITMVMNRLPKEVVEDTRVCRAHSELIKALIRQRRKAVGDAMVTE